jgi:tetratricopeptide (TPR) repeat protein
LKRLGEIKLQVTERRVAAARAALNSDDIEGAIGEYESALAIAPELSGLRIDLANLFLDRDDASAAVAVLEADPGQDRQVLLRLGEVEAGRGNYAGALEAYRRILTREPRDAEALGRAFEVRQALEMQQMPEEYRRIFSAPRISRADLAALLAVKVPTLGRLSGSDPQVAVDISGSWARDHVLKILALDLMEVYPNHTFQPAATVRRGDLARALARILDLVKWPSAPAPVLKDMSPSNLFHDAAVRVVAAGIMDLTPEGAFEPWRPISGQDAGAIIENLVRLIGP